MTEANLRQDLDSVMEDVIDVRRALVRADEDLDPQWAMLVAAIVVLTNGVDQVASRHGTAGCGQARHG